MRDQHYFVRDAVPGFLCDRDGVFGLPSQIRLVETKWFKSMEDEGGLRSHGLLEPEGERSGPGSAHRSICTIYVLRALVPDLFISLNPQLRGKNCK